MMQFYIPACTALTQIVTQVCAKACGRSWQISMKFRTFC